MASQSDIFSQQISDLISGRNTARTQRYGELSGQFGVNDRLKQLENARKMILDTEQIMSSLPKDVNNRLKGRSITQGMRNRILSKEQDPLINQRSMLGRNEESALAGYGAVRDEINQLMGIDDTNYSGTLQDLYAKRSQAWNQEGNEFSAQMQRESQDRQARLQRELANINKTNYEDFYKKYLETLFGDQPVPTPTPVKTNAGLDGMVSKGDTFYSPDALNYSNYKAPSENTSWLNALFAKPADSYVKSLKQKILGR